MKTNIFKWVALGLVVVGVGKSFGSDPSTAEPVAAEPIASETQPWVALNDPLLDTLRGGFDFGNGLRVSFGFVRTVAINGDLVRRTSFNFPDLKSITPDQARSAGEALAQAGVVQNGRNNVVVSNDTAALAKVSVATEPAVAAATIVQNSLNNQRISSLTEINTAVNSMGMIKNMNAQLALKEALLGTLGVR